VNVLIWHVHGSWTTAFVQGPHTYLLPLTPGRGPDGRGRARTWDWPDSAIGVPAGQLKETDIDVVILQRPHEEELTTKLTGRRPGADLPAIYLEHDAPWGDVPLTRHPMADRPDLHLVQVTHFNELFWDTGRTPVTVIEHGVVDPGPRWAGDVARAAVVVNEPVRRGRYTGTDLLPYFAEQASLDVFGMGVAGLPARLGTPAGAVRAFENLPQEQMHTELARRRVYLHPVRWTSLGLSLIEAMHLAMPVVAIAATEATEAIPPGAGIVSTRRDHLRESVRRLIADPAEGAELGKRARKAALARYSLQRFLADWDRLLSEVRR
jgi:glycosyltransferase involved in cell wall biosynthesis